MKKIGILGGMGPEATILLYQKILQRTNASKDQDHIQTIIYSNTAVPDRTEAILNNGEDPAPYLIETAKILENAGAEVIGMPCNTAYHFYDQMISHISIECIHMVRLCFRYLAENFTNRSVMLFATTGTIATEIYMDPLSPGSVTIHTPAKNDQAILMDTIYNEVKSGKQPIDIAAYTALVKRMERSGYEVIILGCTELSYVHSKFSFDTSLKFIDPLDLLAEALVKYALEN